MTNQEYFNHLLFQQRLSDSELANLRSIRDGVQSLLSALAGSPRFYHAGSYGKRTIIRERYDLDMVIYWPSTTNYTLKAISDGVGEQLAKIYRYLTRTSRITAAVHPHGRGDWIELLSLVPLLSGSPPRAWGLGSRTPLRS